MLQPGDVYAVRNRIAAPAAAAVRLRGLLGGRLDGMRVNRLRSQEDYHLLWPYLEHCDVVPEGTNRYPPGGGPHPELTRGDWPGEFIGTWVATATLVAGNTSDDVLRAKLGHLVAELLAAQQPDGYLGTYDEVDRWKSWDLWVQAHCLIGLLTFHEHLGSRPALEAAIRVADRVLADFGPGRRSLQTTGPHGGMASSAILEPLMWLYEQTSDPRYLEFARWLVDVDWESPGGPAIGSRLRAGRGVSAIANAKGGEMLVDLIGLLELHRATGEHRYFDPVLVAWEDISRRHLYVTGSASVAEYFSEHGTLPNDGVYRVGETCVTMLWISLSLSLGRLTGEARFFDAVEQALYNHLLAAQSPDGRGWAYYVGLRDAKRYRWHTDPECCPTRGSRALSMIPQAALGVDGDGLVVNLYESAEAELPLANGSLLGVEVTTEYPFEDTVRVEIRPRAADRFVVKLRRPGWCRRWRLAINGAEVTPDVNAAGYAVLDRTWSDGDEVLISFEMEPRAVVDPDGNHGRAALTRGPLVFAADTSYLPPGQLVDDVSLDLAGGEIETIRLADSVHLRVPTAWAEPEETWVPHERFRLVGQPSPTRASVVELVPFFEAGNRDPDTYRDGVWTNEEASRTVTYAVWLPYASR